ncbi:hypothetical protein TNCV_1040611 [Trichonephila clavipes]|nr:hypothetical protein TNCV_1040611 [Trichonephila clavipes]
MSSFLVLREEDNRNRWCDEQVCPDVGQGIMAPWGFFSEEKTRERGTRPWREKKEKALPWIEKAGEESPGWNGLEESTKKESWFEIGEEGKEDDERWWR